MAMAEKSIPEDKIPLVDPELEKEREEARKARERQGEETPTFDELSPPPKPGEENESSLPSPEKIEESRKRYFPNIEEGLPTGDRD